MIKQFNYSVNKNVNTFTKQCTKKNNLQLFAGKHLVYILCNHSHQQLCINMFEVYNLDLSDSVKFNITIFYIISIAHNINTSFIIPLSIYHVYPIKYINNGYHNYCQQSIINQVYSDNLFEKWNISCLLLHHLSLTVQSVKFHKFAANRAGKMAALQTVMLFCFCRVRTWHNINNNLKGHDLTSHWWTLTQLITNTGQTE